MNRTILLIVALAVAATSCTEQATPDPTTTSAPTTTAPPAPTTTAPAPTTTAAAEPLIFISGFRFQGADTVSVGTTLEVENRDSVDHTWTSVDDVFNSGTLGGGDTFTFTFDAPGEYEFFCAIHPDMTGSITVEP
ncbi:MAG: cupredoxin domain-containing protein [Acidimicrobiia bacterium]|nr:cupredoxin domain-containing protein [Acidimicrobiia bacterium]